jgi:hypothetical protein
MRQATPIAAGNAKNGGFHKNRSRHLALSFFAAFLLMPLFCVERNEQ